MLCFLIIVILLAISMFSNLKFIHPVRTVRWRLISLPIAALWTFLGGYAAWYNFNISGEIKILFVLVTTYLLFAGILQQVFPKSE